MPRGSPGNQLPLERLLRECRGLFGTLYKLAAGQGSVDGDDKQALKEMLGCLERGVEDREKETLVEAFERAWDYATGGSGGTPSPRDVYARLMEAMKKLASHRERSRVLGDSNGNLARRINDFAGSKKIYLDTCYDESRARRLYDVLEKLKGALRGATGGGSGGTEETTGTSSGVSADPALVPVLLLAAEWLASGYKAGGQSLGGFEDGEFLIEAARIVLSKIDGDQTVIPLCPSKGDLAALVYYIIAVARLAPSRQQSSGGSGSGSAPSDIVGGAALKALADALERLHQVLGGSVGGGGSGAS